MSESLHPSYFVHDFLSRQGNIAQVELGVYTHIPHEINPAHKFLISPANMLILYHDLRRSLQPGEEIAFHSRVRVTDNSETEYMHVPLLDYKTGDETLAYIFHQRTLRHLNTRESVFVFSGHSFHSYFGRLLAPGEWVQFLGWSYLGGMSVRYSADGEPSHEIVHITDSRWFPYQSLFGFSSLRWSDNTKPMPRVIVQT